MRSIAIARRGPDGEEGSFTFAVVVWLLIFIALISLVIDGSMEITATETAANIADSIARDLVDKNIDLGTLQSTGQVVLTGTECAAFTPDETNNEIITALGYQPGVVKVVNCFQPSDNSVTVEVSLAYSPLLWGSSTYATASATAAAVTAPTK